LYYCSIYIGRPGTLWYFELLGWPGTLKYLLVVLWADGSPHELAQHDPQLGLCFSGRCHAGPAQMYMYGGLVGVGGGGGWGGGGGGGGGVGGRLEARGAGGCGSEGGRREKKV
jgi:hypothetical protein